MDRLAWTGEPARKFNLFLTGSQVGRVPSNNALIVCLYIQGHSGSHLYSTWNLACFRAAQIQCFHRFTIAKITCVLCNFKNPVNDGWLRLLDPWFYIYWLNVIYHNDIFYIYWLNVIYHNDIFNIYWLNVIYHNDIFYIYWSNVIYYHDLFYIF